MTKASNNPYRGLPRRNFWKNGAAAWTPFDVPEIYTKRFDIRPRDAIAAAGSCFAQHVAKRLKGSGYRYLDMDPPPFNMAPADHGRFGYNLYSARYGNIYTARQLLQLAQRAYGEFTPLDPYWEKGGRFYDPFRPTIEPDGFGSLEEFRAALDHHLETVRSLLEATDIFVFTLGLTEAWIDQRDGSVYPVAPGTAAGTYSPEHHVFHNFTASEVVEDLRAFMAIARRAKPSMRFLLTVSPVPLVATATDQHVLSATVYSKSVLRAAAGEVYQTDNGVDYFPSYEIITGIPSRGMFFEADQRNVHSRGVDVAMAHFFSQHPPVGPANTQSGSFVVETDVVCDEVLLEGASE